MPKRPAKPRKPMTEDRRKSRAALKAAQKASLATQEQVRASRTEDSTTDQLMERGDRAKQNLRETIRQTERIEAIEMQTRRKYPGRRGQTVSDHPLTPAQAMAAMLEVKRAERQKR